MMDRQFTGWLEHVVKEGSREHVISWDSNGEHCSNPDCEINHREDK